MVVAAGRTSARGGGIVHRFSHGDPEPGGLPPAIWMVLMRTGYGTGFFVGERANVVTARHVVLRDSSDDPAQDVQPALVRWVCTGRSFLVTALAQIVREDSTYLPS